MVLFPHAKINLGLQVIEKRHDGFHNINSCLYPIEWCDILEVTPAPSFAFETSGIAIPGESAHNLCVQAYELLKIDFDLPLVHIHLHKSIPIGAGLGGGSSNAAYTLLALRDLFEIPLNIEALRDYASKLGSDCAFFLRSQSALASGKGDILSPLSVNLPKGHLVVVYPNIHLNTKEAYADLRPKTATYDLKDLLQKAPLSNWKSQLKNDFEITVFNRFPEIRALKETLYKLGASYASMSGSGSAVYGIFSKPPQLEGLSDQYIIWSQEI